uniref:PH domain-containing protein n=1 Tax=Paramoeba aestuarina TaxID=180227 RepID=A0A7S4JTT0_9EUKA|eukprot:CAMPEP_0201511262 /NCGR_PEP_ID=MMETSP0161_2-20130828/3743_1 /ASSEMBLY_ACC=CAM_ASM_000251 /TAXON_ID=180227 /ORGANISM="Neoparamoeba aestuarina, Strain SoJaBio B1-5/56/2" /LENGTH=401 /DNA_ID=CAMNT_0047906685 /DNA_START=36 /DNA_END=1241 /DNA_ORIENTATION=-
MGEVRKTWKKRWFQLETTGYLCYYKDASYVTGKPLGSIIVEGCQIEPQSAAVIGRPFAFSINPPVSGERIYNIFADSNRDLQEWVDALRDIAKRTSGKRSRGTSSLSHHKMNYNDNMYSTSLPVQISADGSRMLPAQKRTEKAALAERRQKRMHTSSTTSSDSCYSDDSDFEGDTELVGEEEEDTDTSSSVFRCDMDDSPIDSYTKEEIKKFPEMENEPAVWASSGGLAKDEKDDLKQQVSRLQRENAEKQTEINDLRKRLESGAQIEIEKLKKLLEAETEKRLIAEEERDTAKENEAAATKKLQEEKNRMRDLSHAAFTLQDNVKTVYDGLMKMTTQMMEETTEGAGIMGHSGPSQAQYGASFVESPSNTFFNGSDFVEIRDTVPEGEDSLLFEKVSFLK